ncbi:MarR family winged helix-turn-helix transcriptional regulator [Kitasatospora sp. YST-16]|uniref:MarR family winged helix-turn-helix transcriptional regulator n=1 Tax=unclassified Kitasatospora TaxID=2633591 RepID=UPI0004C433CA|nr:MULTISPECIES: MarR family winged helix-turn-helix transcriptional regulator [unclassified Kitasatospora]WAL74481.1 MarR family winged helix-turn-helix transcriptional regulator [Kitasatospora sp. YST-16]WNW40548.1 MarR family winged helix-turn-helix transcriptional regulator [Streptomyces sp. Li-HN-5-13]
MAIPESGPFPQSPSVAGEIQAFQTATRDLIGVALRSLEAAGDGVSLPQMRMLLALDDLGCVSCSVVAKELGLGASSVTRLADRLVRSGHVVRGADPHHRSVVTLELSPDGRALIGRVLRWREQELARILARLDPALRAATAEGLAVLHQVVGEDYAADLHGPVPL